MPQLLGTLFARPFTGARPLHPTGNFCQPDLKVGEWRSHFPVCAAAIFPSNTLEFLPALVFLPFEGLEYTMQDDTIRYDTTRYNTV